MLYFYIVQDVTPDAARYCSYKPGRTLLNSSSSPYADQDEAERVARTFNEHVTPGFEGIKYNVVAWDDTDPRPFPCDQMEKP